MHFTLRLSMIIAFLLLVALHTFWVYLGMGIYVPVEAKANRKQKIRTNDFNSTEVDPYIILSWTGEMQTNRKLCGKNICRFTNNRSLMKSAKVITFYASTMSIDDFPLPRRPNQLWAIHQEESPKNVPYLPYDDFLQHFNYTSTFSRYSDMPVPTLWLESLTLLTTQDYMLPVKEKSRLRRDNNLAPVLFIQTLDNTLNGRNEYVRELMHYIKIDSFGRVFHNKDLPASLNVNYLNNLFSSKMLKFLGRYKFILSYENAVCDDYITEKFWRPLIAGAIPVYYGAPNIKDWAPNNKSVIYIDDFSSPAALADFLLDLDNNDTEYSTYLKHKYNQIEPIENRRLRESMGKGYSSIASAFHCYVCSQIHKTPLPVKMASLSHYNCIDATARPPSTSYTIKSNEFPEIAVGAKCTAAALDKLFRLNKPYTNEDLQLVLKDFC